MYRFPPMDEKSQCLVLAEAVISERANVVGAVVEAICKSHWGVEVPMPRRKRVVETVKKSAELTVVPAV